MMRHATSQRVFNMRCFMWSVLMILIMFCSICFLRPVWVIGPSMMPTLESGQVLGSIPTVGNSAVEIHRGDVVVLRAPNNKQLVMRVIAVPHDRLVIYKNQVFVNAQRLKEPYLAEPMNTGEVVACILEEDQYFVLGDNRNVSADSRSYGTFSQEDIIAVVQMEDRQALGFLSVLPILLALLMGSVCIAYEEACYLEVHRLPLRADA